MEEFQSAPHRQSYLEWFFSTLGVPTLVLISVAALLAMGLMLVVFLRGRGPAVPAAIMFLLPLPLIVGAIALVGGTLSYFREVGESATGRVDPGGLSYGFIAAMQASSCFCPTLVLSLVLLMILGFRGSSGRRSNPKEPIND